MLRKGLRGLVTHTYPDMPVMYQDRTQHASLAIQINKPHQLTSAGGGIDHWDDAHNF